MSSFIQSAVDHILSEMAGNGVDISEEIRDLARDILKEKLFEIERKTFRELMFKFDTRKPTPPYSANDVTVYQSGAFNLACFAPGGLVEVDGTGRPVPWEKPHDGVCEPMEGR